MRNEAGDAYISLRTEGGLCAHDLARAVPPELRSVVTFHAALSPPEIHRQKPIKASILMLHGWKDRFAPPCMRSRLKGLICPTGALRTTQMPAAGRGMPCAPSSPKHLRIEPVRF
jgi:hypothetical protein